MSHPIYITSILWAMTPNYDGLALIKLIPTSTTLSQPKKYKLRHCWWCGGNYIIDYCMMRKTCKSASTIRNAKTNNCSKILFFLPKLICTNCMVVSDHDLCFFFYLHFQDHQLRNLRDAQVRILFWALRSWGLCNFLLQLQD